MDLDQLLDEAAPPVSARTPELRREVDTLLRACEPTQPRRLRSRLTIVGGVLAAILGLGSVAGAAGLLPGWTRWTTSSGQTCEVDVDVSLRPPGDGEPNSATFSLAEQKATLEAAEHFLEEFDYDTIDVEEAIAGWRAVEGPIRAGAVPAERQPRLEGEELELHAVTRSLIEQMRAELAGQGHDLRAVSVSVGSDLYLERDGSQTCGRR